MAQVRRVGKLSYNSTDILGKGSFGIVFKGFYEESRSVIRQASRAVAVKRVQLSRTTHNVNGESLMDNSEMDIMKRARDHHNILGYIWTEIDEDFMYVATELCRGTLEDYFDAERYKGPRFLSEWQIVHQVTSGLAYLHSLGIVHRDIKPTNILIFVPERSSSLSSRLIEPQVKLADFGFAKVLKMDKIDFTNTDVDKPTGTRGWMAPEVYESNRIDLQVDTFALGCIFGYTLSRGRHHPFGNDVDDRIAQIMKQEDGMTMVMSDLIEPYSSDNELFELMKSMLEKKPMVRPTVAQVLNSSFFKSDLVRGEQLLITCFSSKYSEINLVEFERLISNETPGLHLNDPIQDGLTPLHLLCRYYTNDNMAEVIRMLIQNGADVNCETLVERETPLHLLCRYYGKYNLINIVQLLIEKGADVNAKDVDGKSPFRLLCRYYKNDNLFDLVQLFGQKGADDLKMNGDGVCYTLFKWTIKLALYFFLMIRLIHLFAGPTTDKKEGNESNYPMEFVLLELGYWFLYLCFF